MSIDVVTLEGRVFACLVDGELTILINPGVAIGGEPHWMVPMGVVEFDARLPNTPVWVTVDRSHRPWTVTRVARRKTTREHWDEVYRTKGEAEVSWYQPRPERSLALITSLLPNPAAPILDVGGGASRLVDELLAAGYADLTVLDVSAAALRRTQERLGAKASQVQWIAADITTWQPAQVWQLWHDRAVFHFLTASALQDAYIAALKAGTAPGSILIMSCFALDGPERCSGLPVQRYSPATLAARIGTDFMLLSEAAEQHTTPWGSVQNFAYAVFQRR